MERDLDKRLKEIRSEIDKNHCIVVDKINETGGNLIQLFQQENTKL